MTLLLVGLGVMEDAHPSAALPRSEMAPRMWSREGDGAAVQRCCRRGMMRCCR
jgi:hypothetical protein